MGKKLDVLKGQVSPAGTFALFRRDGRRTAPGLGIETPAPGSFLLLDQWVVFIFEGSGVLYTMMVMIAP